MDTDTQRVASFLNGYLFRNVWNQPYKEYRRVLEPKLVIPRSLHGTWDYYSGKATLPDVTKDYYVYHLPMTLLAGIPFHNYTEWNSLSHIMDNDRLDIRFHCKDGQMLYRGLVYILVYGKESLLIAIEKNMTKKILGSSADLENVYFEVYYDTDSVADLVTSHYHITSQSVLNVAYSDAVTGNKLVFLNGKIMQSVTIRSIKIGDFVECIEDSNILTSFNLDPFDGSMKTYNSNFVNEPAYIVHIPKEENPDYLMLTHNTCDVFALPNDGSPGLLIHRAYTDDRRFIQLTHADFAIPETVINDYRDALGQDYKLLVIVRHHDSNNYMIRDANYIDILYLHTDEEIVNFLADIDCPMDFWKASVLEDSKYSWFMFHTISNFNENHISEYVEALGYYQTLSLICPQVQRYTIDRLMRRWFLVPIPLIFTKKENTIPHVFIDGIKIHDNLVQHSLYGTDYMYIHLDSTVPFNIGSQLVVEFHENDDQLMYVFSPSLENNTLTIPAIEFSVYSEWHHVPVSITGFGATSERSYTLRPEGLYYSKSLQEDGTTLITFHPISYGRTYLIQNKTGLVRFDQTSEVEIFGSVIRLTMTKPASDTTYRPILGNFTPLVYLNGRSLTLGVDFSLTPFGMDVGQATAFLQILIQNSDYLETKDNKIEVYLRRGEDAVTEFGHPTPGNPTGLRNMLLWFPSLSMAYTDGLVISGARIRHGSFSMDDVPDRYGALSGARTSITYMSNKYLSSLARNQDDARIELLRDYLEARFSENEPDIIDIPKSHRIYSLYGSMVTQWILDNYGHLNDNEYFDFATAWRTSYRKYQWVKQYDLAFSQTGLDRRFIDVFPAYQKLTTKNRELYNLLQRLATSISETPDSITDGDLVQ